METIESRAKLLREVGNLLDEAQAGLAEFEGTDELREAITASLREVEALQDALAKDASAALKVLRRF